MKDGRPVHPQSISRRFQRLAVAADLPRIQLHDLRDSYAPAASEAGIPLKVVSERLGHSSVLITWDTYSHVRPGVDRAAADKVADLIFGH
jgi:integrase